MNSAPQKLHPGSHIRVIAPASAPKDWKHLKSAVTTLEMLGFTVSFGKHFKKKNGFIAGSDQERLSDLHDAFKDKKVDAIFAVRGGYGTTRLLNHINYSLVAKNKKPVLGFSDITALQLALLQKSGNGSYSSPNFLGLAAKDEASLFSLYGFCRSALALTEEKIDLLRLEKKYTKKIKVLRKGNATGRLVGGNLSLVCSLLGTPYFPNLSGSILFLEETNEVPYRFDRLLTQLLNAGVLKNVKAIVFGQCAGCADWEKIVAERFGSLKVPLVIGLPFGHVDELITLPVGVTATLQAQKKVALFI